MKERDYFSKHVRSDELGDYVAISSTKFKLIIREFRELENRCEYLESHIEFCKICHNPSDDCLCN